MSEELRAPARDAPEILDTGRYLAPSGASAARADRVRAAVAGTALHPPGEPIRPR
ncbi:hypothetical protein GCM10010166_50900 [Couchioplanes caeruleus subsp. azureus]|nr:hypothetical protein GCM10010166_50900 [Couchioplanes caeruleus subsp. azureus]